MRRFAVGLAFGCLFLAGMAGTAMTGAAPAPQVIKMSVKKFEYSVREITIKKGTPVVIEITSEDRVHGTFEYLCDIFCGEGHEDVTGTLIVTE